MFMCPLELRDQKAHLEPPADLGQMTYCHPCITQRVRSSADGSWGQGPDKLLEVGLLGSWAAGSLVSGQDRAASLTLAPKAQKGQE